MNIILIVHPGTREQEEQFALPIFWLGQAMHIVSPQILSLPPRLRSAGFFEVLVTKVWRYLPARQVFEVHNKEYKFALFAPNIKNVPGPMTVDVRKTAISL